MAWPIGIRSLFLNWKSTCHDLIEDDAQGVHVGGAGCLFALAQLRRHVARCSPFERIQCHQAGQAEIHDDYTQTFIRCAAKHNVAGLQVTMNDATSMG